MSRIAPEFKKYGHERCPIPEGQEHKLIAYNPLLRFVWTLVFKVQVCRWRSRISFFPERALGFESLLQDLTIQMVHTCPALEARVSP